jgi:hypothetical protein
MAIFSREQAMKMQEYPAWDVCVLYTRKYKMCRLVRVAGVEEVRCRVQSPVTNKDRYKHVDKYLDARQSGEHIFVDNEQRLGGSYAASAKRSCQGVSVSQV